MFRQILFCSLIRGVFLFAMTSLLYGQTTDPFTVSRTKPVPGPRITAYLGYQIDQAWRLDDQRRELWASLNNEGDVLQLQRALRQKLLAMIGGLPETRTPLNPQIAGKLQGDGFHVEKILFESLPGFHVTAALYVPEPAGSPRPAVLVACGHSEDGKAYYQTLCLRLVKRGYVVLCWDPVGQGERSQFWDAAQARSRYNLICGEHAVLGNLAYLAGTNLVKWEIWDGIRAFDYLLTRPEVDPKRINITGTSGGGTQAAHIAALDERIHVAAPSCYITALPMRMANRTFNDPDSDPEQDSFGMVSEGVDHAGLLLLMYPRPLIMAVAVEDFFPIEGARRTFREIATLYRRMNYPERIALTEGYHGHKFSDENQEAAFTFLDRFNGIPPRLGLDPVTPFDKQLLQCTKSGQVVRDFPNEKSLMELIREYYLEHKVRRSGNLAECYYADRYPGINRWEAEPYAGKPSQRVIGWEAAGSSQMEGISIDRYLLHHSESLTLPLLHIHEIGKAERPALLWFSLAGKATATDWTEIKKFVRQGYQVLSWDFRGLGEDRMLYKTSSADAPDLVKEDLDRAYASPLSSVLANYVYNSLLVGRPYFLQMIEDAEIVTVFARKHLKPPSFLVTGQGEAGLLAESISRLLPGISLLQEKRVERQKWSSIVEQKVELWPIHFLMPGGAYIE